jgi:histidinol-phosphatase (PHP family)
MAEQDPARVFSPEELVENFMGNTALVRSLLVRFMERTECQAADIPVLAEKGDWEIALREAHTLKGSARSLSALELGDAAARWEEACRAGDPQAVRDLAPKLAAVYDRFKAAAKRYLAEDEAPRGLSCLHTHTVFCDGRDDVETMCRRAWEKGLSSLGFSAHAPITKKTGIRSDWNLPDNRLEEYLDAVREARRRWEGRLPVYLGLEVDYLQGLMGPADRDYRDLGLDYLIGSVHFVIPPHAAPFTVDGSREELERGIREGFGGDGEALAQSYWDQVAAMIRAGGFEILGHVDLIKKNNQRSTEGQLSESGAFFDPAGPAYLRRLGEIAALAAGAASRSGMVVELNTGGMNRAALREPYPSPALLRLFRERGIPVIINADAHRAEDLDGHYGEALEALRNAGYTETVLFGGREGDRPRWTERKIPACPRPANGCGAPP